MSDHRIFIQHSNLTRAETVALNRENKEEILKNERKHKTRIKKTTNTTTGTTSRYNQDVKSFNFKPFHSEIWTDRKRREHLSNLNPPMNEK